MTEELFLSAFEPEVRIELLLPLRSDTLTSILGYAATKSDAARLIAHNERLSQQITIEITYHEPH